MATLLSPCTHFSVPRACALVATLFVLASTTASGQQPATLSGTVRDAASSRPLLGAVVTLSTPNDERTTRTDETGAFVFARVAPGSYTLAVRRLGYEPARRTIDVVADVPPIAVALARVELLDTVRVRAARQAIYGAVGTAKDLRPLPSATVKISGAGSAQVTADSTGHFFVPIRTPGVYLVRVRANGYEPLTVSVTVPRNEGVEVVALLDSATGPASHVLAAAFAEFDERIIRRRPSSVLVPRTELRQDGDRQLLGAIRRSRSFASKALRFGDAACVFVDGRPKPGMSLNAFESADVEAIELYTATSDASRTLLNNWPRNSPCGDSGGPRVSAGRDVIQWVVIWLKH